MPKRFGGIWMIVRRSLRQHAVSTCITVLSVALGTGLVMSVFSVSAQAQQSFTGGPVGFDAVLGARGSQLQLVLNAVFHLETSPGNLPWSMYQAVRNDSRVELAVPYAVGDNYRGYRIVGTSEEMFTRFEYQKGRRFQVEPGGRFFDPSRREGVIGSMVADRLGLKVGGMFNPYHGVNYDPKEKHEESYTIVGVLQPTNSPSDRVVWIPIEGVFRLGGHVLRGTGESYEPKPGEAIPDEHKEVSAVMLKFRNPQAGFQMEQTINKQGKAATLAWPIGSVMAGLFEKIGWINRILEMVAYLVVVVAAGSILAGIYNTMNERRREFAILRSLGARRGTLFGIIVFEAASIAAMGAALGFVVHAAILASAGVVIRHQTGVALDVLAVHPVLWRGPAVMILLGAVAGLVPAWRAYSTDVASNLVPTS